MKKTPIFALMASAMLLASCGGDQASSAPTSTPASEATSAQSEVQPASQEESLPEPEISSEPAIQYQEVTIDEAIWIAAEAGETPTERIYILTGKIKSISKYAYGEMILQDDTGEIFVYGVQSADGSVYFDKLEDRPDVGDTIKLLCTLNMFGSTPQVKSGWLLEVTHATDERVFEDKTIAEAREAAAEALVSVTGVVAKITFANGHNPNGFYLVDSTGSIYIYSPSAALDVQEGNLVKANGVKTYYILETELEPAAKFGYQGSCQLQDAKVVSNDKGSHEFDKSWIKESTVKDIVETPFDTNITTNIYKVNAYLEKRPGQGFVNYYFFDLDQATGSYVYTLCNGSDFAYLDAFDGKIVTVYLSALNAKATMTGCNYRFIPVLVEDNGFQFDPKDGAEFAVNYYGVGQFLDSYDADPSLSVISSVTSELLGLKDVPLTYSSDNESIAYFETVEDGVVFHTKDPGETKINVSATYADVTFKATVDIKVNQPEVPESLTVAQAIAAEDETTITVRGIVASSLVNQSGFLMIDETGVIAIRMNDKADLEKLSLGNEVIIQGTKTHFKPGTNIIGQICVNEATLVLNLYGSHDYSTASFDSTKTVEELYSFSAAEDHSAQGYVVNAQLVVKKSAYSTNYYVTDGKYEIYLYAGSGGQYAWLDEYLEKDIKIEMVMCNWNTKAEYRGMIISIQPEGGSKIINNLNFR